MFKNKNLIMFVTLLILLAAIPTIAMASELAKFDVSSTLFVAGNEIRPGRYDVRWESDKQGTATVTFETKGILVKVQGKIV